jgi:hypothetical protein
MVTGRRALPKTERPLLPFCRMVAINSQLKRYAGRKLTRRMTRSIPWIGGIIALATLGSAIRKKGLLGGTAHTALDMIPYVGGVKNIVEAGRGRDFIRDKRTLPGAV